jgi:hypothetical protein
MPVRTAETTPPPAQPYDRDAIFHLDGPIEPTFVTEAIRTIMRTLPLDPTEPPAWSHRRMFSAMLGLAALNPRDEIEIMLGVQALSAYHAAAACWRIGMNHHRPHGDSTRHITTAATAARTFDTMLKAIERRQAKPLAIPAGRPPGRVWPPVNPTAHVGGLETRCQTGETSPGPIAGVGAGPSSGVGVGPIGGVAVGPSSGVGAGPIAEVGGGAKIVWTPEDLKAADAFLEKRRIAREDAGLDIASTDGILPGGGMLLPADPTPQQQAYIGRRLGLMYRREYQENLRNGIKTMPKIRPIRTGDLIP